LSEHRQFEDEESEMGGVLELATRKRSEEAARQKRRTEVASLNLDPPWALFLDELLALTTGNPTAADRFRIQFCELCKATYGESELTRADECNKRRCGLRNPTAFEHEQQWVVAMVDQLLPAILARPGAVHAFNDLCWPKSPSARPHHPRRPGVLAAIYMLRC